MSRFMIAFLFDGEGGISILASPEGVNVLVMAFPFIGSLLEDLRDGDELLLGSWTQNVLVIVYHIQ